MYFWQYGVLNGTKGSDNVIKVHYIIILISVVLFSLGFFFLSNRSNVEYTSESFPSYVWDMNGNNRTFFIKYDKKENVTSLNTGQLGLEDFKVSYVIEKDGKLYVKLKEKKSETDAKYTHISIFVKGRYDKAQIYVVPLDRDKENYYLDEVDQFQ